MDKTIRVGDIYTEAGNDGIYIRNTRCKLAWLNPKYAKTTREIAETWVCDNTIPNTMNALLTAREAISLHRTAIELGMNEYEDVTYWLRDYIVEKIREAQTVS